MATSRVGGSAEEATIWFICGANIQGLCLQSGQNLNLSLLFRVQGNCPHTSSMADIFPEQLNRTFSLSSDSEGAGWLTNLLRMDYGRVLRYNLSRSYDLKDILKVRRRQPIYGDY